MIGKATVQLPVARTERLIVEEVGAETVVYDEDSGQAHHLSPLASVVFARSDGRTSVTQLAQFAGSRLGEPVDVQGVEAVLAQLKENGLMAASPRTISRRTMLRRTGAAAGVAFATPVITSIMTPAFAQASPDLDCPRALCASQSEGDAFCNCANTCPGCPNPNNSDCKCPGDGGLFVDSCECLNCNELSSQQVNRPDLCPSEPFTQCPPGSSPSNPGPGGCHDPNKFLDGRCFKRTGDTSEPCPDPSQFVQQPI
jgi:hypothetical protein